MASLLKALPPGPEIDVNKNESEEMNPILFCSPAVINCLRNLAKLSESVSE